MAEKRKHVLGIHSREFSAARCCINAREEDSKHRWRAVFFLTHAGRMFDSCSLVWSNFVGHIRVDWFIIVTRQYSA